MKTWILCVSLLTALWGCSKITITEKAPELTVIAKGRVFQSMEGVIAKSRAAINSICQDRLKPEDKIKVAPGRLWRPAGAKTPVGSARQRQQRLLLVTLEAVHRTFPGGRRASAGSPFPSSHTKACSLRSSSFTNSRRRRRGRRGMIVYELSLRNL